MAAVIGRVPVRLRRLLCRLAYTVLAVSVLFALFLGYGSIDNRWYRIVTVVGGSMEPTIWRGDMIVITRPPRQLGKGMIVTMQVGQVAVTHRIVEIMADGALKTKGDANAQADDWGTRKPRVVGLYRFRIPRLGYAVLSVARFRQAIGARWRSVGVS